MKQPVLPGIVPMKDGYGQYPGCCRHGVPLRERCEACDAWIESELEGFTKETNKGPCSTKS